jgi:glycosyltransferase involved in cell wall biosynthesis
MLVAKAFQKPNPPRTKLEAQALSEAGYRVHVFAWDREAVFPSLENINGVIVHSFGLINVRRFSRLGLALGGILFQIALVFQTVKLITRLKQRPILHAHDINTLLPSFFLRSLGLSPALVYDCRELTYEVYSDWFHPIVGTVVRTIEEHLLRHVDAVITPSDAIADYLRRFCKTVETIYNFPSLADIPTCSKEQARLRLGLPIDAFIVSSVGTIRTDCRYDLLLEVASLIEKENIRFLVVGDGPMLPMLRKAAEQIPPTRLMILPPVTHTKALCHVFASDLTWAVYQNRKIPWMPWKFFESLACGVPVLVESGTYRAKLVEELGCGVVPKTDCAEDTMRAIVSLAEDKRRQKRLSAAAKNAALARNLNWEAMSRKLVSVYDRLREPTEYRASPSASILVVQGDTSQCSAGCHSRPEKGQQAACSAAEFCNSSEITIWPDFI